MSFNADYFNIVYVKPYTRVGVYAIGLALGYLIHKKKGKKLSKVFVFSGSVIAGVLGFVNTILSWNAWIPLSRLTYAAYLIHLIILTSEIGSIRSLPYADMYYIH
ncbi:nose resistant to fluoxetine protein 6 [Patella vulgata]|uniref:nose resistant to fluoxetine protein 6 n=1 Tax=Patella vulgata TaxID=6465 RepID=UPI0024A8468F|nr:nose resistant to fluoxetine protein 6 [Patella vulgata]